MKLMRRSVTVVLAVLSLMAAIAPPSASAASSKHDGEFFYLCEFSHRSKDDPIAYPRQPRASHRSDFYGNTRTNAYSTAKKLAAGSTTCRVLDDKSAYYYPTLMRRGAIQRPWKVHIYYRNQATGAPRAFPFGFKYVAGNPKATSAQHGWRQRYFWQCGDTVANTHHATPPDCPNDTLTLMIRFPQCWDGVRKDSWNHHAHMVYPRKGTCPKRYPVLLPQLQVHVQWNIHNGASGPRLYLSSGSIYGIHSEFFDAWKTTRLNALIDTCIDVGVSCHPNDL